MKNTSHLLAAGALGALFVTFAVRPAHALPSSLGAYPATDISTAGNFRADFWNYTNTKVTNSFSPAQGINYGVGPDKDGLLGRSEIGYDFNFNGPNSFGKRLIFNAKTQLFNNDKSQVRVVAGGWDLGSSSVYPNYVYLLASKNFNGIGRFHVGVARALSNPGQVFAPTGGRTSLHLAYDRLITPKLQFVTDYYSGKSAFAGIQPSIYYSITDKASIGAGYFRLNSGAGAAAGAVTRNQLYFQFSYNFDFKGTGSNSNPSPATGSGPAVTPPGGGGPAPAQGTPGNTSPAATGTGTGTP